MIIRIQAGTAIIARETWNVHGERVIYEAEEQVVSGQIMGRDLADLRFWVFWKRCCLKDAQ